RAVALDDTGPLGQQTVTLADGTGLTGLHAVVLAQGHVPARPTPEERRLADAAARHGLVHIRPANPADLDLSAVRPREPVRRRGLGLIFCAVAGLGAVGREGMFDRVGERLVDQPSGREPRLYAGSRRGVPHHARGENEKGAYGRYEPRLLTQERIARLRGQAV